MAEAEDDSNEGKAKELNLNMRKESEIVAEFCNLLEQSRQWFKSLRWKTMSRSSLICWVCVLALKYTLAKQQNFCVIPTVYLSYIAF